MNIQNDIDQDLALVRKVAMRMDAIFTIPGTRITVGLDNFFGLVPVIGDLLAAAPSVWMIHKAYLMGATPGTIAFMVMNTAMDLIVGSIPVIGDIFDVVYNANIRNFRALETNLNRRTYRAREVHSTSISTNAQVI